MAQQKLVTIIDADTRKFRAGLNKAKRFAKDLATNIVKLGAIVAAAFVLAVRHTAMFGDAIDKMSKRTGLAVDEIQALKIASDLAGTDIGVVEKSIKRMTATVVDLKLGLSTAKDGFDLLGLSLEDVEGKSVSDQFDIVLGALGKMTNKTDQLAAAQKVLGKSGVDLIPLAQTLKESVALARARVEFLSPEQIRQSAALVDNVTLLKAQIGSVVRLLTLQAFPGINRGLERMSLKLKEFTSGDEFAKLVDESGKFSKNIGAAFQQLVGGDVDLNSMADVLGEINSIIEDLIAGDTFKSIREFIVFVVDQLNKALEPLRQIVAFLTERATLFAGNNVNGNSSESGIEKALRSTGIEASQILLPEKILEKLTQLLRSVDDTRKQQTGAS